MSDLFLTEIKYTFSQECNTNGSTAKNSDDEEKLTVTVESCHGSIHTAGGFLVMRTKGWSFNNMAEIKEMIDLIEKGVGSEV